MAVIRIALAQPATSRNQPFFQVPMRLRGTGEVQQGKHGERKLQRQHDLAEGQQFGDAAVAAEADDEDGGQDGERARDEAAHPGPDAPVHEAFHHDLAGERAGDGAALAAGQQGDGEQRAGGGGAQQRGQGQVGDANPVAVGGEADDVSSGGDYAFLAEEYGCGENENGGVDEEGDGEGDDGIDGVEADGAADGRFVFLQLAALHQRGVQVEIVGHHGRADDADGDVEHAGLPKWGVTRARPISRKLGWVCGRTKISMK